MSRSTVIMAGRIDSRSALSVSFMERPEGTPQDSKHEIVHLMLFTRGQDDKLVAAIDDWIFGGHLPSELKDESSDPQSLRKTEDSIIYPNFPTHPRSIWDIIGRDPMKWEVNYSFLGWGIKKEDGNSTVLLSYHRAMRFARTIHQFNQYTPTNDLP